MSRLAWIAPSALLLPLLAPSAVPAPALAAKTYKIDSVHSSALFRIKHNNASYFHGRFNDITGTVVYDEANPAGSSVEVKIKAESVETGNGKRNEHLKSPDFFNAAELPVLSFKSTGVKKGSAKEELEVTGDLTIHGVTKPLTAKVAHTGTGKGQGGEVAGFETVFTIKRTDFGMSYMVGPLGDEVQVTISLEGQIQ
jgi:polyisoprenoid-binding protein YceI